ncbi:MAG TPA: hypothetical protein VGT60_07870 [Candidatus Limnocylindria bacterium]|nr:hypothetical protein [Candidatus Limnocylindria bacterium]
MSADPARSFLVTLDALSDELDQACGYTRLCIVLDRRGRPLTVSFEKQIHAGMRLMPTAYLELELRAGAEPIGYVTMQNSLARTYSPAAESQAHVVVDRFAGVLGGALPV